MGLFDKLFKKEEEVLPELNVDDSAIVAIADGKVKAASIRAVLYSHRIQGLITDESTARELLLD